MDVDEIVEKVIEEVKQEGGQITDSVVRSLNEGTMTCKSIKDEYLQKGDVEEAIEVYTKIAGMYNRIADIIQNEKQRKILRMHADFWIQSRDIKSELEVISGNKEIYS